MKHLCRAVFILLLACLIPASVFAQALSGLPNPGLTSAYIQIPNAGTTGTTLFTLTKLTGAPSTAVITATTDTAGVVGIAVNGVGTSGSALLQVNGLSYCVFDGATTAGDYVTISSTTAGDCHDAGFAPPASAVSGQIVGQVLSTNASGGTYVMRLSLHHLSRTIYEGVGGTISTANTFYFSPLGTNTSTTSTTESGTTQAVSPVAGTIENLQCRASTAGGANSDVFTLQTGTFGAAGSASSLTCTMNSATNCNDVTHSAAVTAGQAIDIKDVTTGTTSRVVACSFDLVF